jgi:hypothetical protein
MVSRLFTFDNPPPVPPDVPWIDLPEDIDSRNQLNSFDFSILESGTALFRWRSHADDLAGLARDEAEQTAYVEVALLADGSRLRAIPRPAARSPSGPRSSATAESTRPSSPKSRHSRTG